MSLSTKFAGGDNESKKSTQVRIDEEYGIVGSIWKVKAK